MLREFDDRRLVSRVDSIDNSLKRIATALEWIVSDMREFNKTAADVAAERYSGNRVVTALYRGDVPYGNVEVVEGYSEASEDAAEDDMSEDDRK